MNQLSVFPTQKNTQPGFIPGLADGALTDLEARLVKITADGYALPADVADLAVHVLLEGAADGGAIVVAPLVSETNVRIRANGVGSKGDILVLCDPAAGGGANAGKVEAIGATEGSYFSPGIAEEDFVDEQLVKVRPLPRLVHVGAAFTGAAPAATAASNAGTPYGFTTQAQADALVATVRELRAWAIANGFKADNA